MQVLQQIEEQKINIYQFPDTDYDEEEAAANRRLKVQWGGGGGEKSKIGGEGCE